MSIFVDVQTLNKKINHHPYKIIDVRQSASLYEESHIPHAIYLDPIKYISGQKSFFVDPPILGEKLSAVGINEKTEIVIYDDGTNRNAAKAWVALYYIGHTKMKILQGGFSAWKNGGKPISREVPAYKQVNYHISPRNHIVKTIEDIRHHTKDPNKILIDSRAEERYAGRIEPKYEKAGHIPGAKNYVAKEVFNEQGEWKESGALQEHFSTLNKTDDITVSCGTGGSACLNMIALIEAGYSNVAIYPGGFKEWIDANEQVETEKK